MAKQGILNKKNKSVNNFEKYMNGKPYSATTSNISKVMSDVSVHKCNICNLTIMGSNDPKDFFVKSFSMIYSGNDYYIPICRKCISTLFNNYLKSLQDEEEAFERICMHLDLYYNKSIVDIVNNKCKSPDKMQYYLRTVNLAQYSDKTYGDTLLERKDKSLQDEIDNMARENIENVNNKLKFFWGSGFEPEEYAWLENKLDEWKSKNECQSMAQETIFKNICLLELQINEAIIEGEKTESLYNQLNNFMSAANIKPSQKNENAFSDSQTFGTLIEKWEQTDPIPESEPSGLAKYISVWFLGHLCKMLGIKNEWQELYDKEVEKYTCYPPNLNDAEESSVSYEDIFGGVESD